MENISIEELKSRYHWLSISPIGKNLEEDNGEIIAPICDINEPNFTILLNVIRFWGIIEFSLELLDELMKFELKEIKQAINKTIHRKEERKFYKKIYRFVENKNNKKLCNIAVIYKYFDILQYAKMKGCKWNTKTYKLAAKTGNIKILKYLYDNGCKQDCNAHWAIAKNGHFKCLEFIKCSLSKNSLLYAIQKGIPNCLKYLKTQNFVFDEETYFLSVYYNHIEIVKVLHENKCPYYNNITEDAIINGHLEIVKFFVENNYELDNDAIYKAAKYGYVEIMKYLYENGFSLIGDICGVCSSNFECLKYAREIGCEWGHILKKGISTRSFECLKFAYEDGCPFNKNSWKAVKDGGLDCLEFFYKNNYTKNPNICSEIACNLELLKYAHEHGFVWDSNVCCRAAYCGNLECLKYAHENGCSWNLNVYEIANNRKNEEILKYLEDNGWKKEKLIDGSIYFFEVLKISKEKRDNEYSWLKSSPVELEEDILAPVCHINESNFLILFNVIRFWKITEFSFELLDELKKFYPNTKSIIENMIEDEKEKEFYMKIPRFLEFRSPYFIACEYGYLDILKYAHEFHGIYNHEHLYTMAKKNKHFECVKFLEENGYQL